MKCRLSVVTFIWDGFYDIKNLVDNINDVVTYSHEILIFDNREKEKNKKIEYDTTNCRLIDLEGNKGQFWGKKIAADYAEGDYIWFIDCDDELLDCVRERDLDKGYDLIEFGFDCLIPTSPESVVIEQTLNKTFDNRFNFGVFEHTSLSPEYLNMYTYLWIKYIKTSFWKKIADLMPAQKMVIYEDWFLSKVLMAYNPVVYRIDKICYRYYIGGGISRKNRYSGKAGMDTLRLYATGLDKWPEVYTSMVPEERQGIFTFDFCKNYLAGELIEKFINNVDESIRRDFLEEIIVPNVDFNVFTDVLKRFAAPQSDFTQNRVLKKAYSEACLSYNLMGRI